MEKKTLNKPIWQAKPSQIKYLHIHIFNMILIVFIIYLSSPLMNFAPFIKPLYLVILISIIALRSIYLAVKLLCTQYKLYDRKIGFKRGIFNLKYDETQLYRIEDYSLNSPFFLRIFGLSNLKISSNDRELPEINFYAIPKGFQFLDKLDSMVESERKRTGTKKFE